jgi:glycerol-3-phosphate acyltransferase PlsY
VLVGWTWLGWHFSARWLPGPPGCGRGQRVQPRRRICDPGGVDELPAAAVVALGFLAGSVPFSQVGARSLREVDLREVGTGTVSGTALFEVAGFVPLAVFGVLEVGKGAVGPWLARDRPLLAAVAGGAAVIGHNWSPWLGGAGGRGLSPAVGALLPRHPAGSVLLLAGMAGGRLAGETSLGALAADALLLPLLSRTGGRAGRLAALSVVAPMLLKRMLGNHPPYGEPDRVWLWRFLYDRDTRQRV